MSMDYGQDYGPVGPQGIDTTDYVSPELEYEDVLSGLGYTKVSGSGPNAIWQAPSTTDKDGNQVAGAKYTQRALLGSEQALGNASPYAVTTNKTLDNRAPDITYDASGRAYTWQNGKPVPMPTFDKAPAGGGGGITPYQQAQIDFQQSQAEYQRQQDEQNFQLQQAQNQARLAQANQQIAVSQATLDWNKSKDAFQRSQDMQKEARDTQAQIFQQQFQLAQAKDARDRTQQQMQLQVAMFNAQQQRATEEANQAARIQRQGQLQSLNSEIGTLASNANDLGRYASTVLANSPWGQQSGALAASDLRTDKSLQPLQGDLNLRSEILNAPDPYTFQPLQIGGINTGTLTGPAAGAQSTDPRIKNLLNLNPWWTMQNAQEALPKYDQIVAGNAQAQQAVTAPQRAADLANEVNTGQTPRMAGGGLADGAFIAGEAGKELVIPLGEGQALVLNQAQQKRMKPDDLKRLKKMADGGVFSGGSVFGNLDTTQARQFSNDALKTALQGTPWETGGLPSAAAASTPGFDPLVARLLASLNALAGRGPAESYLRNAALLTPAGLNARVIGRTA